MPDAPTRPDVYAALDTSDLEHARTLARDLAPVVDGFKVGMQLYYAHGADAVRMVADHGRPIFLDLKLHDIPNTVAGAVKSLSPLGVRFLTIHTGGGPAMLSAAVQESRANPGPDGRPIGLLGVTVLTSLDDDDLLRLGVAENSTEHVIRLAGLARGAGCVGLVAAPQEIRVARAAVGETLVIATPGIRPAESGEDDQRRVMTPKQAADYGSDLLVIGRPITAAPDPVIAARLIIADLV